jgi:hypothetical protein
MCTIKKACIFQFIIRCKKIFSYLISAVCGTSSADNSMIIKEKLPYLQLLSLVFDGVVMEKVVVLTGPVLNLPSAAMAVMIMADIIITTTVVVLVLLFLHYKHFGVRKQNK